MDFISDACSIVTFFLTSSNWPRDINSPLFFSSRQLHIKTITLANDSNIEQHITCAPSFRHHFILKLCCWIVFIVTCFEKSIRLGKLRKLTNNFNSLSELLRKQSTNWSLSWMLCTPFIAWCQINRLHDFWWIYFFGGCFYCLAI